MSKDGQFNYVGLCGLQPDREFAQDIFIPGADRALYSTLQPCRAKRRHRRCLTLPLPVRAHWCGRILVASLHLKLQCFSSQVCPKSRTGGTNGRQPWSVRILQEVPGGHAHVASTPRPQRDRWPVSAGARSAKAVSATADGPLPSIWQGS